MEMYVTLVTCDGPEGSRWSLPHYLLPDCINPRPVEPEVSIPENIELGEN